MSAEAEVWDQVPDLLALAMTLTGRPEVAADLVGAVVASIGRAPTSARQEPTGARDLLVQLFVRRRPAVAGPNPAPDLPEELSRLTRGLDRLTPLQRAALVLSYHERVTMAEIAAILDRPTSTLDRSLAGAVILLDADPTEIAATLDALAWQAPEPETVRPAVRHHQNQSRRRRRRACLVGAAIGAALAIAVVIPTVVIPRLPVYVRPSGEWSFAFDPRPPTGWRVRARYLQDNADTAELVSGHDVCTIMAQTLTGPTPPPDYVRRVVVHGHRGGFTQTDDEADPTLSWDYAPGARAVVACRDDDDGGGADLEARMARVAREIRFRPVPLKLPFALSELPAGYEVQLAGHQDAMVGVVLGHAGTNDFGLFVSLPAEVPSGRATSSLVRGRPAREYSQEGSVTVCFEEQRQRVCIGANSYSVDQSSESLRQDVTRVATALRFASDLHDEGTWSHATEALPR